MESCCSICVPSNTDQRKTKHEIISPIRPELGNNVTDYQIEIRVEMIAMRFSKLKSNQTKDFRQNYQSAT